MIFIAGKSDGPKIAGCRIYRVLACLLLAAGMLACAVPAQQDFCPALAAADVTTACYSCYQTRTCSQDETCIRASCCLARCYPACGGMTGPECAGYSCPCGDGGDDGDLSWIVIVGGAAVLGAGLVGGAAILKGSKGKEKAAAAGKTAPDGKEEIRYILQLSTDHITLAPDAPAHLKVTAWKAVGAKPPVPAPEAAITLTVPAGIGGLSIQPASGTGSVDAAIAAEAGAVPGRVVITVTASVGKSAESAPVTIEIPAGRYELDVY